MFICDFHREQVWDRFLKQVANGCVENRLTMLGLLRSVARTHTVNYYEKAIATLQISSYWLENSNLRDYFSRYWLNIKEVTLGCYDFLQQLPPGMEICKY